MKTTAYLIASSLTFFAIGQSSKSILDYNNTKVIISNNGNLFNDPAVQKAAYEVPKGTGLTTVYSAAFLSYAINAVGDDGGSINTYEKYEFFPGPIATNYLDPEYLTRYQSSMWRITSGEINQHIAEYSNVGYVVPAAIASWPGNGKESNGEAHFLAPYVDVNSDGTYNPELGDYPEIRGDAAVYIIMNDVNGVHAGSGFTPLGLELHVMLYQYITTDEIANTNFISAVVVNRSANQYDEYKFGLFVDFDLGGYSDDFVGTDIGRNLAYVYNGDLMDQTVSGIQGYQANPPAFGVLSLNNTLASNVEFANVTSPSIAGIVNLMNGLNAAGGPILDNTSTAVKHMYSGTSSSGWTEPGSGNPPGDRRNILGFDPVMLQANGGQHCYDLAFVYHRNMTTDAVFEAVDSLLTTTDFVQQFYDNQSNDCYLSIASIKEKTELHKPLCYPNPAQNLLHISGSGEFEYEIYTTEGKNIAAGKTNLQQIDIKSLHSGLYLLLLKQNETRYLSKFIKE